MARVLAVDDDALIRRLLQRALEFGGYDVALASDGAEAAEMLDNGLQVDAVITDYAMPNANGFELIKHVQALDASLPCIVVTAFRDLDLATRAMQAGAVGFVPKPFTAEHLLATVSGAVQRRQLASEVIRLRELTPMLERFTQVLSNALECKDLSTHNHSKRLADISSMICAELKLDAETRNSVRFGALLHDIGKVGIPETLLRANRPLTGPETVIVRQHPEIGAAILEDMQAWDAIREIVRHHHEHFDGTGYPRGLAGPEIPIGARIVAVADAFDVMWVGRPYSPSKELDLIVAEFRRERGMQFDPVLVDVFLDLLERSDLAGEAKKSAVTGNGGIDAGVRGSWLLEAGAVPQTLN